MVAIGGWIPQTRKPAIDRRHEAGLRCKNETEGQASGGGCHGVRNEIGTRIELMAGQAAIDDQRQEE